MSLSIDCVQLINLLSKVSEDVCPAKAVSPYLMEQLLIPQLEGRGLTLQELDYSAFTDEELDALMGYLGDAEERSSKTIRFCNIFSKSVPVPERHQMFC